MIAGQLHHGGRFRQLRAVFAALGCAMIASSSVAQGHPTARTAASPGHFLLAFEDANGGAANSANFDLVGSLGTGVGGSRTTSTSFVLESGTFAALDTKRAGRPWASGVQPCFFPLRSAAALRVTGTELDLQGRPSVTIGGRPAAVVGNPTTHEVQVQAPILTEPGWHTVTLTTPAGTTVLPRGVGVLPMVFADPAFANNKAFELVFKGTQGDAITWALGVKTIAPINLGGIHHALRVDPLVVLGGFAIADPSGELRLRIPATPVRVAFYAQAVFASRNPGYAPAAFSNLLMIDP